MMTTHILIAESSSLAAFGAEALLRERPGTTTRRAENADDLLALAPQVQPAVILLGDRFDPLWDTLALVEALQRAAPSARLLVMGASSDGLIIRDLLALGVSGYLATGDDLAAVLTVAIETVLRGRPYLSPTANAEYLLRLQRAERAWRLDPEARAVLRLLAGGCTARQIAARLHIRLRRVYWVTEKLRARFGAATNAHLINRAAAEGFTGFPD
ncbi:MAG: hypothetical protein ACUVS2_16795 [Candidatus Flexifilum sp.]